MTWIAHAKYKFKLTHKDGKIDTGYIWNSVELEQAKKTAQRYGSILEVEECYTSVTGGSS